MYTRRLVVITLCSALIVAAPLRVRADLSDYYLSWSGWAEQFADPNTGLTVLNSLLLPMGGNQEGMGTAYSAVADDASYIEANPAASATLKLTELSVMHRDWITDVTVESLVYTMRVGNIGIGAAGKFVPIKFTAYDEWGDATDKAYITESILMANISYNLFNSYELNLKYDGLCIGANLKAAYRGIPENLIAGQSGLGIMADLGALFRFNFLRTYTSRSKNFSVAAVVKNLGPYVKGEPLPSLVTIGAAYRVARPVLISVDVNVPFSFDPAEYPAEDINVATGIDVTVAEFLSIQSGLWLRNSNPRATLGATVTLPATSLAINASMDQTGGYFSVEARVNLGDQGRGARQKKIDESFAKAYKSYAAGEYEKAMGFCEEVLALQSDHTHALAVKALAEKSLATQKEILKKQAEAAGILEQATGGGAAAQGAEAGGSTTTPAAEEEGLND